MGEYGERLLEHFVDFEMDTIISFSEFQASSSSHQRKFRLPVGKNLLVENILCSLVDLRRKPTKQFIMNYSAIVKDQEDRKFLSQIANEKASFDDWINERQPVSIIDVIDEFKPSEDEFDRLLEILPTLLPRKFSITSSPNVHLDEIHLCAAVESETFLNGSFEGV